MNPSGRGGSQSEEFVPLFIFAGLNDARPGRKLGRRPRRLGVIDGTAGVRFGSGVRHRETLPSWPRRGADGRDPADSASVGRVWGAVWFLGPPLPRGRGRRRPVAFLARGKVNVFLPESSFLARVGGGIGRGVQRGGKWSPCRHSAAPIQVMACVPRREGSDAPEEARDRLQGSPEPRPPVWGGS